MEFGAWSMLVRLYASRRVMLGRTIDGAATLLSSRAIPL
jgi:hypothetical protein